MIGRRIREFRLIKGFKIKGFADKIKISHGSLSDIENENTKPSADTLSSLVRETDINPYWLFTGKGDMCIQETPCVSDHTPVYGDPDLAEINDILMNKLPAVDRKYILAELRGMLYKQGQTDIKTVKKT